ncbi:ABC transporter ATP-binding protein [Fundicoccus ignavus]|uniref:ATP-binding cassette domain-containing protein n=1 Tax=Fundicoccus ignavus TaxID=2664442 RepID=A0A6I2GBI7_9LACT|nr:ABC transporter ATP-binding protein [Fundicoccus ignavus]MRI85130.1 ATP-binding cassette domain-containing protein [Fundicoccus ignavus]MRJ47575.1 ATP-binding cassette domain-containing protein [Fundicoccus ignavus]
MKTNNVITKIWRYLRHYKGSLFLSFFMVFLSVAMTVIEPFMLGLAITELSSNLIEMARGVEGAGINYDYIFWVLVLYTLRGLVNQFTTFGSNYFITIAVQNMVRDLRNDIIHKINLIPVSYYDRNQFGNILGRITSDVESVSNALQQSLLQIVNAILSIVFVSAMMLWLNWKLAIIILISMPVSYLVARYVVKLSQPHFKAQADALGRLNGFVQESFTGFNVIKLYSREQQSSKDFQKITEDLQTVGFKASFLSGMMMPLVSVVSHITYLLVVLVGGALTIAGRLTLGNLQAFTQYVNQVSQPIQLISQLSGPLQSASAAINRIYEVLDQEEEPNQVSASFDKEVAGHVTFENVSFQYVENKPLIRDFNVEVKPGEMVAIVGPTGAGKTTMINLLMRFYDVTKGAIKVDGIDIRDLSRKELRSQFGMVLQDAWLFEGSIKENLRFGKLDATDDEIVEAAKAANVDHFIRTLPGGYDMKMNQESSNISLGQKQLLTIARALLSDPKILILDEATSSVDTRLEQLIQKAMSRLMEGRTSFVIAHRLSTIQEADKILVMDNGQIIEQGNHETLLEQKGFYYDLYQSQFNNN